MRPVPGQLSRPATVAAMHYVLGRIRPYVAVAATVAISLAIAVLWAAMVAAVTAAAVVAVVRLLPIG